MDKRLVDFFYKWNTLEKKNKVSIIDFDLIQNNQISSFFESRQEILKELTDLLDEYKKLPNKVSFIEKKLQGSFYYLNALLGNNYSFKEYVFNTMGITPRHISNKELDNQLEKVKKSYKKVGYEWNKSGIEKFQKDNLLNKSEIEVSFIKFRETIIPKVMNWLGLNFKLNYKIAFVDVDEYWMNWISTDENGDILLQYNLNKRHKWLKGSTEFLVFHEICGHALQASSWKKQVSVGKMNPFCGLVTVFTAEQFIMEGIAESLFYFYPENPFSDFGLVSLNTDHLYWYVWNNAHIMANENIKIEEIIKFVHSYLPYLSENEIKKGVIEKSKDSLGRTYQYIYGISLYYHRLIAGKLSTQEKKEYVYGIYTNAYTPEEILNRYKIA